MSRFRLNSISNSS